MWIENRIKIEGNYDELSIIKNAEFNFEKLHPCPFITEEESYNWRIHNWGIHSPPKDIIIHSIEGINGVLLLITFKSEYYTPHAFFLHLSNTYSSLEITNEYYNNGKQVYVNEDYKKMIFNLSSLNI